MRRSHLIIALFMATFLALGGCRWGQLATTRADGASTRTVRVTSPAFQSGQPIPQRYATPQNVSPPIAWENLPAETVSIAMMVEDPDAPGVHPFVHWIIYNIPPTESGLPEGIPPAEQLQTPQGARQGKNSMMTIGYTRPAPPPGDRPHHYHFQVFALDRMLAPRDTAMGRAEFLRQIAGHVLASGQIIGTHERSGEP